MSPRKSTQSLGSAEAETSARIPALFLIGAALLFWISWFLMPGVGVTDAALIFDLVARQRSAVMLSVATQLLSAALYVPALLGISYWVPAKSDALVRWGIGLLLLGAMGSAMDAVFHLLAYAMTMPGVEPLASLKVMEFMQGPGLRLIAPFILSFFVGSVTLSVALVRVGTISKASLYTYLGSFLIVVAGGMAASRGLISSRIVGLSFLAGVSIAQILVAVNLRRVRS